MMPWSNLLNYSGTKDMLRFLCQNQHENFYVYEQWRGFSSLLYAGIWIAIVVTQRKNTCINLKITYTMYGIIIKSVYCGINETITQLQGNTQFLWYVTLLKIYNHLNLFYCQNFIVTADIYLSFMWNSLLFHSMFPLKCPSWLLYTNNIAFWIS